MRSEPQRHRDTEGFKAPFGPKKSYFSFSLCLCVSVVNRPIAAIAQLAILLFVGLAAVPAVAAEMTGAEIEEALAGNTTDGVWGEASTPYRQYFGANGGTTFVERGRPPSEGRWWTTGDAYCSTWGPISTPSCYQVRREGETLLWVVPGSGKTYPSTVLPGRRLAP